MKIDIPKGKQVIFQQGGGPVGGTENAKFMLETDLTLSFSSSFESLSSSSTPTAFKALSGVLRDVGATKIAGFVGGEFQQLGFQLWKGTEPLNFSLTLKLAMDSDAKKDVIEPTLAVTNLCLPTLTSGGALVGPGPSLLTVLGKEGSERVNKYKQIHCYIGELKIPNIVLTKATPTFSVHTDQHGYPIWATLEVSFSTLYSASDDMLKTIMGGIRA